MSEIAAVENADQPKQPLRNPWLSTATSIFGLLIAVGTLLGVCLHLVGHVAHITELREMGVPSDLFPHDVRWTTINGYYAVIQEWTRTLHELPWKPLAIAAILLAFAIWLYRLPTPKRRSAWVGRLPSWLRDALEALVMSGLSIAAIFYLLSVVFLIAIVPGLAGERAGQQAAQQTLKSFTTNTPAECLDELWLQDKPIMRGHVVAVSEQKIAFYDIETKQVRTFDIGDFELRTRPVDPNRPVKKSR